MAEKFNMTAEVADLRGRLAAAAAECCPFDVQRVLAGLRPDHPRIRAAVTRLKEQCLIKLAQTQKDSEVEFLTLDSVGLLKRIKGGGPPDKAELQIFRDRTSGIRTILDTRAADFKGISLTGEAGPDFLVSQKKFLRLTASRMTVEAVHTSFLPGALDFWRASKDLFRAGEVAAYIERSEGRPPNRERHRVLAALAEYFVAVLETT